MVRDEEKRGEGDLVDDKEVAVDITSREPECSNTIWKDVYLISPWVEG